MEKIIIVGPRGCGKTTLAKAIISGNGAILTPCKKTSYRQLAVECFERVAFEEFRETECRYIKMLLTKDSQFNLTHIVCTFLEQPKWLTKKFAKINNIKVFHLNSVDKINS